MKLKQGMPIKWFADGDILISAKEPNVQWYLNSGKLSKITTGNDFEEWKPKPNDLFYRMASAISENEVLELNLKVVKKEGLVTEKEYDKLKQILDSKDPEAINLVDVHLTNLNKKL